jgi:hypothetical protein
MSVFDAWKKSADSFAEFVQRNGGLPYAATGAENDYAEHRDWWIHQISRQSTDSKSDQFFDYLDTVVPGWNADTDKIENTAIKSKSAASSRHYQTWESHLEHLVTWVAEHERFPQRSKTDREENDLAVWRLNQKVMNPTTADGIRIRDERLAILDERVPGWRGKKRREYRTWEQAAAEFVAWVETNGRLPRYPTDDADEQRHNFWMINMRSASKGSGTHRWDEQYGAFLDEKTPGWRGSSTVADGTRIPRGKWEDRAQEVADWVKENGHLPRYGSDDAVESRKYIWLAQARAAANGKGGKWTPEREALLTSILPEWR